jgi:two-component system response regulator FixJ
MLAKQCDGAVLVVDDDPAVVDSMALLLGVLGYPVRGYASGSALLADPEATGTCLILDQHMPGLTGLELAAKLRAGGSDLPILLVTGAPSPSMVSEAARLGVEKVLEKPPSEDDLLSFVGAHASAGPGQ